MTTFHDQRRQYGDALARWREESTHALAAREGRDAHTATKRDIEADFGTREWEGATVGVRADHQRIALSESAPYQDTLAEIRLFEHDAAVADIAATEARYSMRLAIAVMEHETALSGDLAIFAERFADGQPPERGNAAAIGGR